MDLEQLYYSSVLNLLPIQRSPKVNNCKKRVLTCTLSPGTCVICGHIGVLRSMDENYSFNGVKENYSKMLMDCFQLKIISLNSRTAKCLICHTCIYNLRSALVFRSKIEAIDTPIDDINDKTEIRNLRGGVGHSKENESLDYENFNLEDSSSDVFIKSVRAPKTVRKKRLSEKNVQKSKLEIPPLDPSTKICPKCDTEFEDHVILTKHYKSHFPQYLCNICGKTSGTKANFLLHIGMHSGRNKYPCRLCNKVYKSPGALQMHGKIFHEGEKPHPCQECPERFNDHGIRNKHAYEVHGIPCKRFICSYCNLIFYRLIKMKHHINRVHLKQKDFICEVCNHCFFTKGELNKHMVRHSGVKNFHCQICGKTFARARTLTEHVKIHTDIRDHKCTICGKAFVQKSSLNTHLKIHVKYSYVS